MWDKNDINTLTFRAVTSLFRTGQGALWFGKIIDILGKLGKNAHNKSDTIL